MPKVLIIDDEKAIRNALRDILQFENFEVEEAADGAEGIRMATPGGFDLVLCDIKMPKTDGMEVLTKLQELHPDLPVVMITGHGTIDTAVEALKKGAYDFIAKPPDLNRLLVTVRNALDRTLLVKETKTLRRKVSKTREMVGTSPELLQIRQLVDRVGPTEARVLITGGNGTGKELVARWIHEKSQHANGPMVEVNCAAIPSERIES